MSKKAKIHEKQLHPFCFANAFKRVLCTFWDRAGWFFQIFMSFLKVQRCFLKKSILLIISSSVFPKCTRQTNLKNCISFSYCAHKNKAFCICRCSFFAIEHNFKRFLFPTIALSSASTIILIIFISLLCYFKKKNGKVERKMHVRELIAFEERMIKVFWI